MRKTWVRAGVKKVAMFFKGLLCALEGQWLILKTSAAVRLFMREKQGWWNIQEDGFVGG
jgi:hypothetical protein